MKKTILILVIFLITTNLYSQKIHSEYKFKREKTKSRLFSGVKWNYFELDSLVLYKDKTFHRTFSYRFHELGYSEFRGKWNIKNDTLKLNIKQKKENKYDENWNNFDSYFKYKIRKRKLTPIYDYNYYDYFDLKVDELNIIRKLRRIKY
jgi:hypothetical protein